MRHTTRLHRSLPLLAAVLTTGAVGCASYQATPPHAVTAEEAKHPIRVTQRNGSEMMLRAVHVSHDTLYGTPAANGGGEVAIPFSSIYSMAARESDGAKTMVAISAAALVVGLATIFVASQ